MCGRLRGECSLSALERYIERLERGRRKVVELSFGGGL
jgi:hypothetical protein